jgi:hypothetical protein
MLAYGRPICSSRAMFPLTASFLIATTLAAWRLLLVRNNNRTNRNANLWRARA